MRSIYIHTNNYLCSVLSWRMIIVHDNGSNNTIMYAQLCIRKIDVRVKLFFILLNTGIFRSQSSRIFVYFNFSYFVCVWCGMGKGINTNSFPSVYLNQRECNQLCYLEAFYTSYIYTYQCAEIYIHTNTVHIYIYILFNM